MEPNHSKLAQILRITMAKLASSKDQSCLVSEIAQWNDLTPHQVAALFRRSPLKSRTVTKLGQRGQGFTRLELQGLLVEIDSQVALPTEAPTRDWGCTDCFHVFESRERSPACPACQGANTKVAPPNRAPAVRSAPTAFRDEMIQTLCNDYNLTDYRSADHTPDAAMAPPSIATPQGNIAGAPLTHQGADIGAATGRAAPGSMMLGLNRGTGEAKVGQSMQTSRSLVEDLSGGKVTLPKRRGTHIVASDRRPLPPAL